MGAAVKYRGVTIGQVTEIALVAAEYGQTPPGAAPADAIDDGSDYRDVLVRFEIDTTRIGHLPAIQALVQQGVRARIAPQGLTGLSYLSLDFTDAQKYPAMTVPWTPRYQYIPSVTSTLSLVQDAATVAAGTAAEGRYRGPQRGWPEADRPGPRLAARR